MTKKTMHILGIDPGYGRCGYGVIERSGNSYRALDYGCITTDAKTPMPERLFYLAEQLNLIIKRHRPERAGVEELFFAKNTKTALLVAQARGVILLALRQNNVRVFELKPNEIKQALTGYGRADKKQMQEMTRLTLNLDKIPQPDDAADALAAAFTASIFP